MHAFTWWQELFIILVISPATYVIIGILLLLFVAWAIRKIYVKIKSKKSTS